jgi:hypothetical protein
MGSPVERDLEYLYEYASNAQLIFETGGGGLSTKILSKAAIDFSNVNHFSNVNYNHNIQVISIELRAEIVTSLPHVINLNGWSITENDMIRPGHPKFVSSRYKNVVDQPDINGKYNMLGETDLIRKAIKQYGIPDLFFCDTGEYCGYAEWLIMKEVLKPQNLFICHDIYYPKSIKCFQVVRDMELDENWEILLKTNSAQGLCVGRKIK